MSGVPAAVAYYWGEDLYAIDRAARALALTLGGTESPLTIWSAALDDADAGDGAGTASSRRRAKLLDDVEERLATAPLFGGGTLVVLRQPGSLIAEHAARDRLLRAVADVPRGNGLAIIDLVASGARAPAGGGVVRDAVAAAGGDVREFPVPTRERMEAWLDARARELGTRLGPGAARLLAERIGAYVREGDVDRRRQTELANGELEKLALYRPDGLVSRDDVAALVAEAVPGSTWAFLDAAAQRTVSDAARLADRLLRDGVAIQVLVSQLHRRLRELVVVRDLLASGQRPADLVRVLGMQPFRVQKLAEQAGRWPGETLARALDGLLEVDLLSKGIGLDGRPRAISDERSALAVQTWLVECVAHSAPDHASRTSTRSVSMANTQRPSLTSRSASRSGSR